MNIKMISQCALAMLLTTINVATLASTVHQTSNKSIVKTKAIPLKKETNIAVYTEDKQTILISADQPEFILKLKSNPSTGYTWFLREYDANLIEPVKHSFEQPTEELIGASGFEEWTFKVKPAGFVVPQQTAIRMIYARPWQSNDSSTQLVFHISTQS